MSEPTSHSEAVVQLSSVGDNSNSQPADVAESELAAEGSNEDRNLAAALPATTPPSAHDVHRKAVEYMAKHNIVNLFQVRLVNSDVSIIDNSIRFDSISIIEIESKVSRNSIRFRLFFMRVHWIIVR
jgi:hypothetical protein